MFELRPVGRYQLQVCTTRRAGCAASDDADHLQGTLGIGSARPPPTALHRAGGECLGACGDAPVLLVNDDFYEDLDEASLKKVLDALQARRDAEGRPAGRPPDVGARGRRDHA